MKPGPNTKRQRGGRSNGRRPHFGHGTVVESNGPDVKVRGNAGQVLEKYQTLARDALSAGDRVAAESYLQHAEHYYRIMNANAPAAAGDQAGGRPQGRPGNGPRGSDGEPRRGAGQGSPPAPGAEEQPPTPEPPSTSRGNGQDEPSDPEPAAV